MATVLYWFRRDLRIEDNSGLAEALATGAQVLPVFVLDPTLIPSAATYVVLLRALNALDAELRSLGSCLVVRRGDAVIIIPELVTATGANAVFATRELGTAPVTRDARVTERLVELGVRWQCVLDDTLVPAEALRTSAGRPYTVFTPYHKSWLAWLRDQEPATVVVPRHRLTLDRPLREVEGSITAAFSAEGNALDRQLPPFEMSTQAARIRLAFFMEKGSSPPITRYHLDRDIPGIDGTSRLSAHLAWGTLSIRAAYLAARSTERVCDLAGREGCRVWVKELAWRDFYHHLLEHIPYAEHRAMRAEYVDLHWEGKMDHFDAWCAGETGYPIVDAAMRQLRQTGWMHNRARMIVASFLVKDLLLDWKLGEHYFSQRLIDYDLANNNGGWQWSASTGTDAQPYFRVFNPSAQGERYDGQGKYVRAWVPELAKVPLEAIHTPWTLSPTEQHSLCPDYPPPLVDHGVQRERAIALFKHHKAIFSREGSSS